MIISTSTRQKKEAIDHNGRRSQIRSYGFLVITLLAGSFLFACNNSKRNIQAYYIPLEEIEDGLVYEYHAVNTDSLVPFYWYFRLFEKMDRTLLSSTYYDHTFTVQQLSTEEIVSTGVILNDLYLYGLDTLTGKAATKSSSSRMG